MLRSLYSGISGLKNHQVRMDVVGNNISNVNTTGYKSGRVNFMDSLSQYYSNNPAIGQNQVGTGMKIGSINNNYTQGALQNTGRTLDLAIQGNGFFAVKPEGGAAGSEKYTRDGIFFIDNQGYIVNSQGLRLQGIVAGAPGTTYDIQISDIAATPPKRVAEISISEEGVISGSYTDGTTLTFANANKIVLYNFANTEGLKKEGGNLYTKTTASGDPTLVEASSVNNNTIASGYLEMSNVDLSQEMVDMIVTQRGFQANARTITVSDTLLEELIQLKR
ncbi:flagellar hook-basal body protein [Desulforamulus ferrireducens]|uniref:Flagellar hook protein FlgE n=1 Tax=Desulforamulus ferrireducens TaxID=1833852 RepID=A0A1S6IYI0_9FIRM|nr:flagellar hook-basal body complex protein [Desulforamulus ferrireducens]AQS59816.1 flagellar basal body rod protein FlgG [Desulforamulus ferrireducens]